MSPSVVLSRFQAAPLLAARGGRAGTLEASFDLGRTTVEAGFDSEGVMAPGGARVPWSALSEIARSEHGCFIVGPKLEPIRTTSNITDRVYGLYATTSAPSFLVSGFLMHRVKGVDPLEDTRQKTEGLRFARRSVLDTATGLGYTSIAAARAGARVTTVELDPAVHALARLNPWSSELFELPEIRPLLGDSSHLVAALRPESFDIVLHDPPAIPLAGDLYGEVFYRSVLRVLRSGGSLFHYIGDPRSSSGKRTTPGVIRRLRSAGFERVRPRDEAFGVVATRPRN